MASSASQLLWRISATSGNSWNVRRRRIRNSRFSGVKRNAHEVLHQDRTEFAGAQQRPQAFLELSDG